MNSVTRKLRILKRVAEIIKRLFRLNSSASQERKLEPKKAATAKRTYDGSLNAPLEELPTELRLWLLSVLKLDELQGLVRASRVFYQDYHRRRKSVLWNSLKVTLSSVVVDAYAVHLTGSIKCAIPRTNGNLAKFVTSYHHRRLPSSCSIESEELEERDILEMVSFYLSVMQPLTRYYTEWALGNLKKELGDDHLQKVFSKISESESVRLLRSAYRFQLCCNLYGCRFSGPNLVVDEEVILKDFLGNFEPWEAEEISCFYTFVLEKFDNIFDDIEWDLHEDNPKFMDQERPPTPDGAHHLQDCVSRETYSRNVIAQGLRLLNFVTSTIQDHDRLVSEMEKSLGVYSHFELEGALSPLKQRTRRRKFPTNRDKKERRRDPLPFTGDSEQDGKLGPPLGWTTVWGDTYSNVFGQYISKAIQRWGYVFWDAARLQSTGANEVLMRQWKEALGTKDPRDDMPQAS